MIDLNAVQFKPNNDLGEKPIDIVKARVKIILEYMTIWSNNTKFIDTRKIYKEGSMAHEFFMNKNIICGQVLDSIT